MSRVVVILVDGMDSIQVEKLGPTLPTLWRLRQQGTQIASHSVFPPDSPTACASLYTGLNPARHGVTYFLDPLEKAGTLALQEADNSTICGKTFWDLAGQAGKRVYLQFPYLGYPVWPVNGIMLGRASIKDVLQTFPASLAGEHSLAGLNQVRGFPGRKSQLAGYVAAQRRLVLREMEFAKEMLGTENWDLFFVYSGVMDTIHHYFWKYQDESDPGYPGASPFSSVLSDFYRLYDRFIGEILDWVGPETSVVLASDHGHGRRPFRLMQLNELLRQQGLLVAKSRSGAQGNTMVLTENLKRKMISFVSDHGLGNPAAALLRRFPSARRIYTNPPSIDWQKTVACTSDLSGIKSYYYGGVRVLQDNLQGRSYEEVRQKVISALQECQDPDNGAKLAKWVCRREDLYQGQRIDKFPDVVFELDEKWGVGWTVNTGLFGSSISHNLVPGSHKIHSPIFFVKDAGGRKAPKREANVMDTAPTVLDLLGVTTDTAFDGQSIFAPGKS